MIGEVGSECMNRQEMDGEVGKLMMYELKRAANYSDYFGDDYLDYCALAQAGDKDLRNANMAPGCSVGEYLLEQEKRDACVQKALIPLTKR